MAGNRRGLLEGFIRSDASPDGKWWVDVPVGLSVGETDEQATVDAVCLTSRDQELPETYPDHTGTSYVSHTGAEPVELDRAEAFRVLREKDIFTEETAVLVAVESGNSSVGTVGNLLALQELLEADWDWSVEERILVSDEDSDHVNYVCGELSVRAVRVA